MKVTSSLRLTSTVLTIDDFELALPSRADFCWGKGDHKFSLEGRHMGGFQSESYAVFDLFEGAELPLADVLQGCAKELIHLRDLFARNRQSGGSAELCICRGVDDGVDVTVPAELLGDLKELGLDVVFELNTTPVGQGDGLDAATVNIDSRRQFVRALAEADEGPGPALTVCVKYRSDRKIYEASAPGQLSLVGDDWIADPGFGSGPVSYSKIEWLCVPAVPRPPLNVAFHAAKYAALVALCDGLPGVMVTEHEVTFHPRQGNQ